MSKPQRRKGAAKVSDQPLEECLRVVGHPDQVIRDLECERDEALSALLAEREARERAEREVERLRTDAHDWRHSDTLWRYQQMRTAEAVRDAAVARAEQAEAERDQLRASVEHWCRAHSQVSKQHAEWMASHHDLARIVTERDRLKDALEQFGAEILNNRDRTARGESKDWQAALDFIRARAALGDGNDEGTSTTAEPARDVGREQRNRETRAR